MPAGAPNLVGLTQFDNQVCLRHLYWHHRNVECTTEKSPSCTEVSAHSRTIFSFLLMLHYRSRELF